MSPSLRHRSAGNALSRSIAAARGAISRRRTAAPFAQNRRCSRRGRRRGRGGGPWESPALDPRIRAARASYARSAPRPGAGEKSWRRSRFACTSPTLPSPTCASGSGAPGFPIRRPAILGRTARCGVPAWPGRLLARRFDWRAQEAKLNAFPQFTVPLHGSTCTSSTWRAGARTLPAAALARLAGLGVRVPRDRSRGSPIRRASAGPGRRLHRRRAVAAGYGLSFEPGQPRFARRQSPTASPTDDGVLGYQRFAAQGGDWGGFITSRLGYAHADKLIGIHLNLLAPPRHEGGQSDGRGARLLEELAHWLKEETGYQSIQGTRPQTLAFGLTDSPAGLAAWISRSSAPGPIAAATWKAFSARPALANISLYWFTGAIGSSFWPYYARMHGRGRSEGGVGVPMGYAEFPREILRPPRSLAGTVHRHPPLDRDAARRPLRGDGTAGGAGPRDREFFRPLRPAR